LLHATLPVQSDSSVAILRFGGDCLLAGHYEDAVGDSVQHAFTGFDLLRSADVAMVNLECPITVRGQRVSKPYNFRMHPRFLPALLSAGIDAVTVANNHIYDYGEIGLFDTISYLDSIGIHHVGAGQSASEAHMPAIIRAKGKHIALFGYYGGGEAPKATRRTAGVADRRVQDIQRDIQQIRRDNSADYIVVNLHWGVEKADTPETNQIEFAHAVIDAGADVIIGHHPHVLQGIERYKSGVIVYSLGNLVFGGNSRDTYETALFEVRLTEQNNASYRLIPIRIERWRARELTGAESDKVLRHVERLSMIFPESIFMNKEAR
jgi:poly-gamma-glutamate capsule biosynthesis protein CapA/YwtB (metallophosphatase superfamily)